MVTEASLALQYSRGIPWVLVLVMTGESIAYVLGHTHTLMHTYWYQNVFCYVY